MASSIEESINEIAALLRDKEGALLPVLHEVQKQQGYIASEAVVAIAKSLNLSRAEVHGVISFYPDFHDHPIGENIVQVCRAEACQAMGSRQLEQHVKKRLGVEFGETTSDDRITLEPVYCLGNCACAPSVSINQKVYARVDAQRFDALIDQLKPQTNS